MRPDLLRSRPYRLALAAGLIGAAVSGCSQDSTRLSDDPFSNPFSSRSSSDATSAAPSTSGAIESRPLAGPPPQPGYDSAPNYSSTPPRTVPAAPVPAYAANQNSAPPVTGSTASRNGEAGWRWDGGTAVTLQQGETVEIIARRYGVPTWAILRANNFADASRIQPGTRLVIPTYQAPSSGMANTQPAPAPQPVSASTPAPARSGKVHVVHSGETLYSLGRRYGVSHTSIAQANGISDQASLRVGQRLNIPGTSTGTASRGGPAPSQRAEAPAPAQVPTPVANPAPQKAATVTPVEEGPEDTKSLGGSPQFRWPVRGKVISGYGPKTNGQHNDGINLSVPEGTEIKAAENGVVAYAGNELKGYGNLVLLRHADGWMTAYAHNSQLLVKRGDQIRRGQTIARAGQTGGVSSPQVHFEIRKGSTPVDPTQYLSAL
ncbi:MAG TPA: peptidoglycan DD-metalloendopeptidase family protein [Xanthobacteraceae bacterium]|jgi:murein DD-endopeptidase MepM/ murein hydrolase activator NlpD